MDWFLGIVCFVVAGVAALSVTLLVLSLIIGDSRSVQPPDQQLSVVVGGVLVALIGILAGIAGYNLIV